MWRPKEDGERSRIDSRVVEGSFGEIGQTGRREGWRTRRDETEETERERGKDGIVRRLTSCILPGRRRLYRAPLHVQHAPSASPVHVRARTYSRVVLAGPSSRVSTPKTTPSQVARVTSRRCTGSRRPLSRQHGADSRPVIFHQETLNMHQTTACKNVT